MSTRREKPAPEPTGPAPAGGSAPAPAGPPADLGRPSEREAVEAAQEGGGRPSEREAAEELERALADVDEDAKPPKP